jgi:quercetin dioxygenase-like cupin family protein
MRTAVVGVLAAALALLPAPAHATPPTGVTGVIVARWTFAGTDYVLRRITFTPGASTGWHYHDGTLYALVESGTLTRTESDCTTSHTHPAGSSLVEPSGRDHVHIGRNLTPDLLVLDVLYVDPAGAPLATDTPNPGCAFG